MPISASDWAPPDEHAWVRHPAGDAEWDTLVHEYGGTMAGPLQQVIRVARAHGCRSVVIENRYIDSDWRSEFAAFWSSRFETPSSYTRRLHFFRRRIEPDALHKLPADPGYIGYSVLRPVARGPVGRTVLAVPRALKDAVLTTIEDEVCLFGRVLTVTGVPFCQQDTEFVRCAHAASWVAHYTAWRRALVGRRGTADMFALSPKHLSYNRALPSGGMSLLQMQAVFEALRQPAIFYSVSALPDTTKGPPPTPKFDANGAELPHGYWDTRIFSVICRYLNSGFPVIIAGQDHALTLVGWARDGSRIRFIACDDQIGPYETIDSPFTHYKAPWHSIMVPVPPKVFVAGEAAEINAYRRLRGLGVAGVASPLTLLANSLTAGELRLRCYLLSNREYKQAIAEQGRSDEVMKILRLAHLSHFVWVVEAQDRTEATAGRASVAAELVFDSTSNDSSPQLLAVTIPGAVMAMPPEEAPTETAAHNDGLWKPIGPIARAL
jgi:hypothetical protein